MRDLRDDGWAASVALPSGVVTSGAPPRIVRGALARHDRLSRDQRGVAGGPAQAAGARRSPSSPSRPLLDDAPVTRGSARWTRGAVVGSLLVGLSALGHAGAGGYVDSRVVVILAVLAIGVCGLLSALEWTMPRLLVVLGLGQLIVHFSLEASMVMPASAGSSGGAAMDPTAGMSGMQAADLPPGVASAVGLPPPVDDSLWMLWAHVVAVVVASIAVRYGEVLAVRVVDLLARPLLRATPPAPVPPPAVPAPVAHPWEPVAGRVLRFTSSVVRRGPPVPVCG